MSSQSDAIRIILADAEERYRHHLRDLLSLQPGFDIIRETGDVSIAAALAAHLNPDVLLLGLHLLPQSGIPLMETTHNLSAVPTVALLPAAEPEQILHAFRLGARAIMLRSSPPEVLLQGIRRVADGFYWFDNDCATILLDTLRDFLSVSNIDPKVLKEFKLTAQESNIIARVADGRTNKEIGQQCAISERTVKQHLTNIFMKVGVSSRLELALLVVKNGSAKNGAPALARASH